MTANIVFCILSYTTEPVGDDTKVWIGFYSGEHNYHEKVEMVSENFTKLNFTLKLIFTKGKTKSSSWWPPTVSKEFFRDK